MAPQWINYGGGWLIDRPPHASNKDITSQDAKRVLNKGGFFVRWTTEWDSSDETQWWYCIKDSPVCLENLSAKQRYRIKRGLSFNDVFLLTQRDVNNYLDDLWEVLNACNETYGINKQSLSKEEFHASFLKIDQGVDLWGVIDKEKKRLVAYAICRNNKEMTYLSSVKAHPLFLKNEINVVLVYVLCHHYINVLHKKYVCDGERSIRHETNYQQFLVNNLGFRYAYCKLNVIYKPIVGIIVKILYPFRNFIGKIAHYDKRLYDVFCILKQESYIR